MEDYRSIKSTCTSLVLMRLVSRSYCTYQYIFQIPAHFIGNEESLSTNPEKLVRK